MIKKRVISILLNIGWEGWDDDGIKNLLELILNSEGYEAKSLRVPMYVWEEKEYLEKIRTELIQFSPDIVIYYFRAVVSPEAIEFLSEVFEIYTGRMRPATLILCGHSHFYSSPEYEYLLDGHLSIPFGPENLLRAIEYILKKDKNGKMLHL